MEYIDATGISENQIRLIQQLVDSMKKEVCDSKLESSRTSKKKNKTIEFKAWALGVKASH